MKQSFITHDVTNKNHCVHICISTDMNGKLEREKVNCKVMQTNSSMPKQIKPRKNC